MPQVPPPGQPSLTAALRERIGLPLLAAGRRLPRPPLEGQRAMNIPAFPRRPLPHTQKPERLTTRNRKLPKIPNPLSGVEFKSGTAGTQFNGKYFCITFELKMACDSILILIDRAPLKGRP